MALPVFRAAGAKSVNAAGEDTAIIALPAGIVRDDILLMFLECNNGTTMTVTDAAGGTWTATADSPQEATTTRLTVFWSRYNGSQTAPTVTSSLIDHICGVCVAWKGCVEDGNPWDVTSGGIENTSDSSLSATGDTTTVSDCLVVIASTTDRDNNGAQFTSWANGDLSNVTERADVCTTVGGGGGVGVADGGKAVAGAYGATTATLGSNSTKGFTTIALKPAVMTGPLQPRQEIPQSSWSRNRLYSLATLVASGGLLTNVAPFLPTVSGGESVEIVHTKLYQYQSLAAPITVVAAAEVITQDKWERRQSEPVRVIPNRSWITSGDFQLDNSQRPERTTPDKWQPKTNEPVFDLKRMQWVYPTEWMDVSALLLSERATPDKWQPETNQPLFDLKRMQWVYPTLAFDVEPREVAEFVSADMWHFEPSPVFDLRRQQYIYPFSFDDPFLLTQAERSTPDKWHPLTEQPLFDLRRNQWMYPHLSFDAEPREIAEFVSADMWHFEPSQIFDLRRQQYVYPYSFDDAFLLTQAERASVDKWQPESNRPVWDVPKWMWLYPSLFLDVNQQEIITTDKWHPESNRTIWDVARRQYVYPFSFDDPFLLTQTERISIDKWFQEPDLPVWDVQRLQWIYPTLFFDVEPREFPELVSPDSWYFEPVIIWEVKRQQYLYPTAKDDEVMFIDPGIAVCNIYGAPFLFTAANWENNIEFYLQVYMKANVGTSQAKLYNITDASVVTGSLLTTSATTLTRLRSTRLTLEDGKEYMIQFCATGGSSGAFKDARLIAI